MAVLAGLTGCGASPAPQPRRLGEGVVARFAAPPGEIQTIALFGRWLAWGQTGPRGGDPDRTAVRDLVSGRQVVIRARRGAVANLPTGTGDWVVIREIAAQPRSACGPGASDCYVWSLRAHDLRTGRERELARAARPGPQTDDPIPAAAAGAVAWQQRDPTGDWVTRVAVLATGSVRTVARGPIATRLSIDGGWLYLDDARRPRPPLLRVRLSGGPLRTVSHEPVFRPSVAGGVACWVRRMVARCGAVGASATTVAHSAEVYGVLAMTGQRAVVDETGGALLAGIGRRPRRLVGADLDPAGREAIDGDRVAYALRPIGAERSTLVVRRLADP